MSVSERGCREGLEQEENTIWKVFGQTFYSVFESKGRNMRIYCVPCPYLTSPSVPQWSELRRGEPATESVERIHPVGTPLCCPRPQNNKQTGWLLSLIWDSFCWSDVAVRCCHIFIIVNFFIFYSRLSVLCVPSTPAPSSRHHLSLLFLLPALAPVHLCPRPTHTSSFSLSSCCTLRALRPAPSAPLRLPWQMRPEEEAAAGQGRSSSGLGPSVTRLFSPSP